MKIDSISLAHTSLPEVAPPEQAAERTIDQERQQSREKISPASSEVKIAPEELLDKIKALTENGTYSVRFEVDDRAGEMIIRLVDTESGEVIRQIPPEELIDVLSSLRELRGNIINSTS